MPINPLENVAHQMPSTDPKAAIYTVMAIIIFQLLILAVVSWWVYRDSREHEGRSLASVFVLGAAGFLGFAGLVLPLHADSSTWWMVMNLALGVVSWIFAYCLKRVRFER
jgi:predicted permease